MRNLHQMKYATCCFTLLALLAFGWLAGNAPMAEETDDANKAAARLEVAVPEANADASDAAYSSQFGVFANGGESGSSNDYSFSDRITNIGLGGVEQKSGSYVVVDLLAVTKPMANNGLALGQGTDMLVSWSDTGKPPDAVGYDIYRSNTGEAGSFSKLNLASVPHAYYVDRGLDNGTYTYKIYLIDSEENATQWTKPFSGVISVTHARDWMLY